MEPRRGKLDRAEATAMVMQAWTKTLDLSDLAVDDDFFGLGGHSLLVLEAVDEIEQLTSVTVPLQYFFENPTIRALAEYIASAETTGPVEHTV